jgi:hypothetical protein
MIMFSVQCYDTDGQNSVSVSHRKVHRKVSRKVHPPPSRVSKPNESAYYLNSSKIDSSLDKTQKKFLPLYSESDNINRKSPLQSKSLFSFEKLSFFFWIIVVLNLFFLISLVVLFIVLLIRRSLEGYLLFKRNKCLDRYRDFITGWLYDEQTGHIPETLLSELKDRVYREVFTTELLSLHTNLTGESAAKLVELYHLAGLKAYSIKKACHPWMHVKAKGFRELAQMEIKEGNAIILKYLNSKNTILCVEAQLAWIQLNPDNPLSFYDDPKAQLTEWGQLNSLIALKKIEKIQDFGRWISSPNKSVAIVALKMSGIYKEFEHIDLVANRLNDPDSEIRHEAIITLGKMAIPSQSQVLQQLFPKEELANKTEIIRSLTMMSDTFNIPFFENVLLNEKSVNLRILSAKGLVSLDPAGANRLNSLFLEADSELKKIIIHAKDDRI